MTTNQTAFVQIDGVDYPIDLVIGFLRDLALGVRRDPRSVYALCLAARDEEVSDGDPMGALCHSLLRKCVKLRIATIGSPGSVSLNATGLEHVDVVDGSETTKAMLRIALIFPDELPRITAA